MLIYCTLQMHVQQATYANELHVNVQQETGIEQRLDCRQNSEQRNSNSFFSSQSEISF